MSHRIPQSFRTLLYLHYCHLVKLHVSRKISFFLEFRELYFLLISNPHLFQLADFLNQSQHQTIFAFSLIQLIEFNRGLSKSYSTFAHRCSQFMNHGQVKLDSVIFSVLQCASIWLLHSSGCNLIGKVNHSSLKNR